jgi:hypothetical protein
VTHRFEPATGVSEQTFLTFHARSVARAAVKRSEIRPTTAPGTRLGRAESDEHVAFCTASRSGGTPDIVPWCLPLARAWQQWRRDGEGRGCR